MMIDEGIYVYSLYVDAIYECVECTKFFLMKFLLVLHTSVDLAYEYFLCLCVCLC
jgi:hypothetical protein